MSELLMGDMVWHRAGDIDRRLFIVESELGELGFLKAGIIGYDRIVVVKEQIYTVQTVLSYPAENEYITGKYSSHNSIEMLKTAYPDIVNYLIGKQILGD